MNQRSPVCQILLTMGMGAMILLCACSGGQADRSATLPAEQVLTSPPPTAFSTLPETMNLPSTPMIMDPAALDELTYEEMRQFNPPPPLELKARLDNGGVRLEWTAAGAVSQDHAYTDVILEYVVYRRRAGESVSMRIGNCVEPHYLDGSVRSGESYYYSVSAIYEGSLEGERSDEIFVRIP